MGLAKQAYSAWVVESVNAKPRKWHLTAYFTYSDLPSIPTVDQDPLLRSLAVPPGIYRSGKARSRTSDAAPPASSSSSGSRPMTPTSTSSTQSSSSARSRGDNIVLPSLQSAIVTSPINMHAGHYSRTHAARMAEDQRMIQMLNSRPIL